MEPSCSEVVSSCSESEGEPEAKNLESGVVQLLTKLNLIVLGQKEFPFVTSVAQTHTGKLIGLCI